jgi:uncharacterized membrane protein YedE/YeeE
MSAVNLSARPPVARLEEEDLASTAPSLGVLLVYLLLGVFFGVVLIKSEVVSWFRIQEMFRFDSFHMYGVLGSAVGTAALSLFLLRRFSVRSLGGEPIHLPEKHFGGGYRYALGGSAFGLGWALTGACPGPIVALIGYGITPFVVVLAAALAGTWTYAHLRPRLPH